MGLLNTLKPEWWFSAHLHCRFEATVVHHGTAATEGSSQAQDNAPAVEERNPDEILIEDEGFGSEDTTAPAVPTPASAPHPVAELITVNPDEIVLDDEEEDVVKPPPPPPKPLETKFLALDKCLPQRQFLEVSICLESDWSPTHHVWPGHRRTRSVCLLATYPLLRPRMASHHESLQPVHVGCASIY